MDGLVSRWKVSAPDIKGQVTLEGTEGGFFHMQHVDLVQSVEIIGHEREFGATEPSENIKSRWFDTMGLLITLMKSTTE
jgi:hypothetical protein